MEGRRGNGGDEGEVPGVIHPWEYDRVSGRGWPGKPKVTEEHHLDSQGRRRLFRIEESFQPTGAWLEAVEVRDGAPTGWSFRMSFDPEVERPPYRELREKVQARLATRDLVRDPDAGRHEVMDLIVRARVLRPGGEGSAGPDLIVDGEPVTWEELGRAIEPYEGWGLRIEIVDGGEE